MRAFLLLVIKDCKDGLSPARRLNVIVSKKADGNSRQECATIAAGFGLWKIKNGAKATERTRGWE